MVDEHKIVYFQVLEIRNGTREAWTKQMRQMSLQLEAMQSQASDMHQQFKVCT